MKLVKQLFLCAARMNFTIIAKHVPGKDNNIADSLSRFSMQVFRQLAPRAHLTPVMVPPAVLARLDWPWDRSSTKCALYYYWGQISIGMHILFLSPVTPVCCSHVRSPF